MREKVDRVGDTREKVGDTREKGLRVTHEEREK